MHPARPRGRGPGRRTGTGTRRGAGGLRVLGCRGIGESQHADGGLAHVHLADLAACRHREVLDYAHVARDLVVGKLAAGVVPDIGCGHRPGAGTQPDPRHDLFAEPGVWYPDDLDVPDVRVGVEEFLDLARRDVLPAPDDHVLEPA